MQLRPPAQAGPLPQRQLPFVQLSAVAGSQATQAPPTEPQVASEGVLQLVPLQQPLAQVVALQLLQAPLVQVSEPGQASHVRPELPQAVGVPLYPWAWQDWQLTPTWAPTSGKALWL